VNKGQKGYFRTAYAPEAFKGVAAAYPSLAAADQTGVLSDAWALGEAGYVPVSEALELTLRAPADADPIVQSDLAAIVGGVYSYFEDDPRQPEVAAYAKRVLAPIYARLGWDPKPGESANDQQLRQQILNQLGGFGDEAVLAEARKRFAALQGGATLPPAVRRPVLAIVARNATPADWDAIHAMAQASKNAVEKNELYQYLGAAKDDALAQKALELSISGEPPVTTAPGILRAVGGRHHTLAFDFYVAHLDAYKAALEVDSRNQMFARLVAGSTDAALLDKLEAYAKTNIPETAQGDVRRTLAAGRNRIRIKGERTPEIAAWIAAHKG
jgi:aminopeptidase N